jgi:ABC-type sugar transport system substrate-binding protein
MYAFNAGGTGGVLDFRSYIGNFGGLGIANDLNSDANGNTSYTAWATATRAYLAAHPDINVVMWAWCWGANTSFSNIDLYLSLMEGLERDFPNVKFVYQTGRTMAQGAYVTDDAACNARIRDYCITHNKILYDFYDIECYDPNGSYYGDKRVDEACNYDSNGDGVRDSNWAISWQNAHPGGWYPCEAPHTQPLNANQKAFAAWALWARLAGWDGN